MMTAPIRYLNTYDLLLVQHHVVEAFGGIHGITEKGYTRLDTAVHSPRQSMFGTDLYPDLYSKVAALVHSIITNHPFSDGNKRTAVVALAVMLAMNGHTLTASNDDVYAMALAVVADMGRAELAAWIATNSAPTTPA